MRRYLPRRTRRRRRILATAVLWFVAACAVAGLVVVREPSLVPGGLEFIEQARFYLDILGIPRAVHTVVRSARFWGPDLLVVDMEIRNESSFVILSQDLRLVDRSGKAYVPSSTSIYYVNRDESLWMRQVNPGRSITGKFAFIVPDGTFGLSVAIETQIGIVRIAPIRRISR